MKVLDYVIIILSLVISLGWIIVNVNDKNLSDNLTASVYLDNNLYKQVPLTAEDSIVIEGDHGHNIIEIKDGQVSITDADCPDLICVNTAPIDTPGQIIVCLPNKLYVEIEGEKELDVDAVSN